MHLGLHTSLHPWNSTQPLTANRPLGIIQLSHREACAGSNAHGAALRQERTTEVVRHSTLESCRHCPGALPLCHACLHHTANV